MNAFGRLFLWELRESFGIGSLNRKAKKSLSWPKILLGQGLMLVFFGYLFSNLMAGPRLMLEAVGRPGLFAVLSLGMAGFVILLGSLAQAILNWDWGGDRAWLMTQPVPTSFLFMAKLLAVGLMLSVNATGILFHWAQTPDGFSWQVLLQVILAALSVTLAMSALSHGLITLAMGFGRRFLSKDKLTVVLAVLGIVGGVGVQIVLNSALQGLQPEKLAGWLASWGEWLRPAEMWLAGVPVWTLPLAALAALALVFPLSGLYIRSIAGDTGKGAGNTLPKPPQVSGLLSREFFLLFREPMYLLNGPLVLFLLPAIMWVLAVLNWGAVQQNLGAFQTAPEAVREFLPLAMGGFTIFLGVLSGMAASCVSREGTGLAWLRSLPVDPKKYLAAKWFLSMVFFTATLVLIYLPMTVLGLVHGLFSAFIWVLTFLFVAGFGGLVTALSIFLDVARPYLGWDQPVAAVKTNMNVLFQILGLIGILTGLGFLTPVFVGSAERFLLILNAATWVGMALAAGPGLRWAARRWARLQG